MLLKHPLYLISLIISTLLFGCSSGDNRKTAEDDAKVISVVERKPLVSNLYYSGYISPIRSHAIISPNDGRIAKLNFKFGQKVEKDAVLFEVSANSLEREYRDAVESYLTARNDFDTSNTELIGNRALHKLGLISDSDFANKENMANTKRINLIKATKGLETTLHFIENISIEDIMKLNISDEHKVTQMLNRSFDSIAVRATIGGVILKTGKDTKKELVVGSELKKGEAIAVIGDLTGLSIKIGISELDLDKIEIGQPAEVTGIGFSTLKLRGRVRSINSEATTSGSAGSTGGLPTFPATVEIAELSPDALDLVRVGMSAKVKLSIEKPGVMMIPIDAVYQRQDLYYVKRLEDAKEIEVAITTGATSYNEVVVTSGLEEGDKISYIPREQVIIDDNEMVVADFEEAVISHA